MHMKDEHFWQDFSSKASLLEASLGASWACNPRLALRGSTICLAENDHASKNIKVIGVITLKSHISKVNKEILVAHKFTSH